MTRSSILDLRSSILDPRSSILDPGGLAIERLQTEDEPVQ
jgi:hypothetical protein